MSPALTAFAVSLALAQAGWREDAGFTLAHLLKIHGAGNTAWVASDGGTMCRASFDDTDQTKQHRWASCEGAGACAVLEIPPATPGDLVERCGPRAEELAALAQATCGEAFPEALADPRSLEIHALGADGGAQGTSPLQDRGPWQGEYIGCAQSASSSDGRVRSWTLSFSDESDEGGPPTRGDAYLQWRDSRGRIHVERDRAHEDLGLDSVVEGIFPIPGQARHYLIAGWRFHGWTGERYAEVVDLSGAHPRRVPRSFQVAGRVEDVLHITCARPDTGKLRHSPIYNHWMRLKGLKLWLEHIPGGECCSEPRPYVLGTWDGSQFQISTAGWAYPPSRRRVHRIRP